MTRDGHMTTIQREATIILVVDDSPDSLGMLNETLEAAGYSVLVALEGRQALTIAQRIRPHLVLLDAVMPGMDGFATCEALTRIPQLANVPIIFMTGLGDPASVVRGLSSGSVDYLVKPTDPGELLARIDIHLRNARRTSSAHSALDSTGQLLFAVSPAGSLLWATGQTRAMFEAQGIEAQWNSGELGQCITAWLAGGHRAGDVLELERTASRSGSYGFELVDSDSGPEVLFRLVETRSQDAEARLGEKLGLTSRESEVLLWVCSGKTNWEIGKILEVSPRTVNKHLEQIYRKLGVQNRTAAARAALELMDRQSHGVRR